MFTLVGRAYVSGVIFGVSKKLTTLLNRNLFTREEHEFAEKTVGRLYSCKPVDSVFSEDGVQKLQRMVETDDFRGMLKLARDEAAISDKPWCVSYVIGAVSSFTRCLPSVVYEATTAYIYGEL
jgi:hypothetical protein